MKPLISKQLHAQIPAFLYRWLALLLDRSGGTL
jgi:hypothetical protein